MTLSNYNYFGSSFPGFSVMDRYISRELIMPFLFGMGLFTSLGIAIGTLFDLVRKVTESGLVLHIAVKVLLLKMPEFIVLAFPMAVLLASLMAYSRLSSDSELIALRSVGVNVYRLVIPAIIFSLLITVLTFLFNNFVAPAANYQATITLERALNEEEPAFKEENIFYPEYRKVEAENGEKRRVLSRLFYAEQFNGKEMQGLTILDRSQEEVNQIITAQSAICDFGDNTCDFFNGTIYLIAPDGSYRNIVRFERQKLQLPKTPLNLANKGRDYNEMNLVQSYEYLNILRLSGDEKKIRKLKVRIQEKIALPFVCLVMGVLGAAMGCRPQNKGKATSFGICVVVIFSYYLLAFLTSSMGILGVFSPFMAAWLPNFFGLTAGGLLLVKAAN
ncbi:LptF/LptG family permease [Oscillatoria salina]|uniref:LptF/LptG family permease n=1 Tax=Oscillatoria salina TaxID=331517 RepID=UPI001CCEE82A|nr:LptF/LptG family permease [Oscillatoria salina]